MRRVCRSATALHAQGAAHETPGHNGTQRHPRRRTSQRRCGPVGDRVYGHDDFSIAAVAVLIGSALGVYRFDVVLSGSMSPMLEPGDIVYAREVPVNTLSAGDVLMFQTPKEYGNVTVTHRIASVEMNETGAVLVKSKGDANDEIDPWLAQMPGDTAWVVQHHVPKVGYLVHWAKSWSATIIALMVAAPMLTFGRRRIRETYCSDEATKFRVPTGVRKTFVWFWLLPPLIIVGAGLWVTTSGTDVGGQITSRARDWHNASAR